MIHLRRYFGIYVSLACAWIMGSISTKIMGLDLSGVKYSKNSIYAYHIQSCSYVSHIMPLGTMRLLME